MGYKYGFILKDNNTGIEKSYSLMLKKRLPQKFIKDSYGFILKLSSDGFFKDDNEQILKMVSHFIDLVSSQHYDYSVFVMSIEDQTKNYRYHLIKDDKVVIKVGWNDAHNLDEWCCDYEIDTVKCNWHDDQVEEAEDSWFNDKELKRIREDIKRRNK